MSDLWDQTEQKLPAEMESLSNGMEVAWYRYMFRKDETNPDPESNASVNKEEPALDEVILKDKSGFRWWNRSGRPEGSSGCFRRG